MSQPTRDVRNPLLFECAWEVANKVGGIYTVIKTKIPVTVSEYGDRYCLIGPLSYKSAPMEVEPEEPTDPFLREAIESMRAKGVILLYGRWLVEGAPKVILFDTGSQYSRLDEWKGDLWNLAGIPTPPNDHETNEAIVFGYIVAWFLGEVSHPPALFDTVLTLSFRAVRLQTTHQGSNRPFPRMAGWRGDISMQEAPHRCHHCVHHPRNTFGPLSLRG